MLKSAAVASASAALGGLGVDQLCAGVVAGLTCVGEANPARRAGGFGENEFVHFPDEAVFASSVGSERGLAGDGGHGGREGGVFLAVHEEFGGRSVRDDGEVFPDIRGEGLAGGGF